MPGHGRENPHCVGPPAKGTIDPMQRIRQLINPRLVSKAGIHESLTASLRHLLPPNMAAHCWVAGVEEEQIRLVTDSGAWATQIRFLQREILKHLKSHHGLTVRRVRVSVAGNRNATNQETPARRPLRPMPAQVGELLRQTARSVEDNELSLALERLARKARKD